MARQRKGKKDDAAKKQDNAAGDDAAKEESSAGEEAKDGKEAKKSKSWLSRRRLLVLAVLAVVIGVGYNRWAVSRPLPSTVVDISVLRAWVNESGGFIHPNLELRDFDGLRIRGVFANGSIPAGEPLIGIPTKLLLSCEGHWLKSYFLESDPGHGVPSDAI